MSLNVLVVDDSDVIRTMISRTLSIAQVPVGALFEAGNGLEALAILEKEWIDLVLADINMPQMDGAEMIEHMRADPATADIPVIVVSTEGATQRVTRLMERGVAAWVRKPFTPEEIRDVIGGLTNAWQPGGPRDEMIDAIVAKVMEQFAFVFPESIPATDLATPQCDIAIAHITFAGAANGSLSMAAPLALCREMSANILGVDAEEAITAEKALDTLAEVVNMTAGNLVTEIEPDATTDLNPPSVCGFEADDWAMMAEDPATRGYLIDDQPVLVVAGLRRLRSQSEDRV